MPIIRVVYHRDLTESDIDRIIALKQQWWPYDSASQKTWLNTHLQDEDQHVLYEDDDEELVAYCDLVKLSVILNGSFCTEAVGIGCLCSNNKYPTRSYGYGLVSEVTALLKEKSQIGVIMTRKPTVVKLFKIIDWRMCENISLICENEPIDAHACVFGKLPEIINSIEIDRCF